MSYFGRSGDGDLRQTRWGVAIDSGKSEATSSAIAGEGADVDAETEAIEKQPKDAERSARYHAKTPNPNYSEFVPQFVDRHGREYAVARTGSFLEDVADDVDNASYTDPPRSGTKRMGRLLMWLRMPIHQRHSEQLPDPVGENLVLYHVATQVVCRAKTDGVFVTARARTGYMFVRDFVSEGQTGTPGAYEPWLHAKHEPGSHMF